MSTKPPRYLQNVIDILYVYLLSICTVYPSEPKLVEKSILEVTNCVLFYLRYKV